MIIRGLLGKRGEMKPSHKAFVRVMVLKIVFMISLIACVLMVASTVKM